MDKPKDSTQKHMPSKRGQITYYVSIYEKGQKQAKLFMIIEVRRIVTSVVCKKIPN